MNQFLVSYCVSLQVCIAGQTQRYCVHSASIESSWELSPQHHSRSSPLEIYYIIIENSSLLFKAIGWLNNTLRQMQGLHWLIEHLWWGYEFLLHSYCWNLQWFNFSFTLWVNYQWFTVSAQSLTVRLCGCMGSDHTNCATFLLTGRKQLLLTSEMADGIIRVWRSQRGDGDKQEPSALFE